MENLTTEIKTDALELAELNIYKKQKNTKIEYSSAFVSDEDAAQAVSIWESCKDRAGNHDSGQIKAAILALPNSSGLKKFVKPGNSDRARSEMFILERVKRLISSLRFTAIVKLKNKPEQRFTARLAFSSGNRDGQTISRDKLLKKSFSAPAYTKVLETIASSLQTHLANISGSHEFDRLYQLLNLALAECRKVQSSRFKSAA